MKSSRVLIKLGGASLQDETAFAEITQALKQYLKYNYQVAVVHGGGPAINAELTRRGITWEFIDGQRVTTPEMMDVIEMVLSGSINKKLVRYMNSHGLPAVGFSGVDRQTLLCEKASPELGLVGVVQEVAATWLNSFVKSDQLTVPVIAPIGCGALGESYNINADWAASSLAVGLEADYLIFLTDQEGILDSQGQRIHQLTAENLRHLLAAQTVTGGMATKVRAILHALDHGVKAVRVLNTKSAVHGLWSDLVGTWCLQQEEAQYVAI
jgi:acetylglutamate kinase